MMNTTAILYAVMVLGGLGVLFGLVLTFAEKNFAVPVDERVTKVREAVAGANCGACGYAGCDAYAVAVVSGEASSPPAPRAARALRMPWLRSWG